MLGLESGLGLGVIGLGLGVRLGLPQRDVDSLDFDSSGFFAVVMRLYLFIAKGFIFTAIVKMRKNDVQHN